MTPEHFDLVVIGSGSGNSLVTPDFADKRVAVIDEGVFGGTCLNVGCIPTKMFVYAAQVADAVATSERYGIDATLDRVRWTDIRDRIFGRIDPIADSGLRWRQSEPNTEGYVGHAEFVGDREIEVALADGGTIRVTADQVVVATGAHADVPSVIGESGVPVQTSDTIMRIDELPTHLIVLGGGFIGMEMAHVFGSLGTRITVVTRGGRLLRHLDGDVSTRFTELARSRWDVHCGVTVSGARHRSTPEGDEVTLTLSDGSTVTGDMLLVSTGRTPNSARLGLDRAGIAVHEDGRVVVDEFGRTTAPGVWSLGDVSSPYQLKHVANAEARAVAHNLVHPDDLRAFPHDVVPSAVFTEPQIASVGLTEEECREQGLDVVTAVQAYGDTAYGWAMEDTTGICKVIADPATGRILGAHLLGPDASSLIQPIIQAMSLGTTAREVARGQYWIHPALAEVIENALLGVAPD